MPKFKILLLEDVHKDVVNSFLSFGFDVECHKTTFNEQTLIKKIKDVHIIGIRSKTQITPAILDAAPNLLAIACFCIGTNQVNLSYARRRGIPVFNSPFCNSRSVAELIICNIIALFRKLPDHIRNMHKKLWIKTSKDSHEIRGKVLGIVGYGHIGSQLSILAESLGMKVIYYDIVNKMPLGNTQKCFSLSNLLEKSDVVTLHVPETPETQNMIGRKEIMKMKQGSYLINASRGNVVDIRILKEGLKSGQILGCALDVFPDEPRRNGESWDFELQGYDNVILTPHIGGSTEEAQEAIGQEIVEKIRQFLQEGCTTTATNFPGVYIYEQPQGKQRITNVHINHPGVLKQINLILENVNVSTQLLKTQEDIGYIIVDVDEELSENVYKQIKALEASVLTRILYIS